MILVMNSALYRQYRESRDMSNVTIYNWDSTYRFQHNEDVKGMNPIIPPFNIHTEAMSSKRQLDIVYGTWFMNDPNASIFMKMMAYELYSNRIVLIVTSSFETESGEYKDDIFSSYMMLFKQRYGMVIRYITDISDVPEVEQDIDNFSLSGLYYLEQDNKDVKRMIMGWCSENDSIKNFVMNELKRSENVV